MIPSEALVFSACSLRCLGFLVSLPLGDAPLMFPRFFLAVGLGIALHSSARISADLSPYSLLAEFVVGFILGAPLRFVVDLSEMVGELIDTARGQTVSAVIDPLHGQGSSDLAIVAKNGAVACALYLGALDLSLMSLARSAQVFPVGDPFGYESLVGSLLKAISFLIMHGFQLCAVWMGAFILVDLGCAVASRLISGLSFTPSAGIVKMVATLLLLLVLLSVQSRISWRELKLSIVPWGALHSVDLEASGLLGPVSTPAARDPSREGSIDR